MLWIKSFFIAMLLSLSLVSSATEQPTININSATVEQLMQLDGIGKAKAEAIIKYRQEVGKFSSLEEFSNVKGIGESLLQRNKDRIRIDDK